jgi:hypothetical protein
VTFSQVPPVEPKPLAPSLAVGGQEPPPQPVSHPVSGKRVNRLAIVAVCVWPVAGLGSIASIVLGHIALGQIKRTGQRGFGLAVLGLVLGYFSLLASIIAIVVLVSMLVVSTADSLSGYGPSSNSSDSSSSQGSQTVSSSELRIGDCFSDNALDGSSDPVPTISCDKKHDDETFAIVKVPNATDYPGDFALGKTADAMCRPLFEKFVGAPLDRTNLDYSEIYPAEDTWKSGDRAILCYAFEDDNSVTGGLEGQGFSYPLIGGPAGS